MPEKLLAEAIAKIHAQRSAFYDAGDAFILSEAEFTSQWSSVDNWYTFASTHYIKEGSKKKSWNCRLNQKRNNNIADKKPEGHVNPSGRELTSQKHYNCSAMITIEHCELTSQKHYNCSAMININSS